MTTFSSLKRKLFHPFFLAKILFAIVFFFSVFTFSSCKQSINYEDYVSELRSNIFLAQSESFSLRIYAVRKEHPYAADGIPRESSHRTEVYFVAPEGNKTCNLSFSVNEKEYGGEMSYDNVRAEYYFSCSLDISGYTRIDCNVVYGEKTLTMSALSVRDGETIPPKNILSMLVQEENELFKSMTDKYGFTGEIHLRLIYEEAPFYYVGVIDRSGKINAYLINAQTGKILAKRKAE